MIVIKRLSKSISSYLARIVSSHPRFSRLARELRFKIWLFRLRDHDTINVNKIIWINPKNIEYCSLGLLPMSNMGRVIGGDWDKSVERFEDLDVYEAFKRRFICDEDWDKTNFYKRVLSEIQKGKIKWKCRNKKELDERLRKIDGLYNTIKTNGYKLGKEVQEEYFPFYDPLLKEDEVTVNIGREGDLFFNDGRHRLSIAKLLNLPKIPVKVVVRHPNWVKLRKELLIFAKMMSQGKLYQPLTHPDLLDLPSHYGSFRFDLIKRNLSLKRGTILDIGAELGYFCHRFEEEGFDCYANEYNPTIIYFLSKLKKIEKRNFNIISKSIFDYNRNGELLFDVVLCLNIFHHFLKTKESYEELILLLKRIRTKELFFQSHKYDEPQMKGVYKNFHPEEFALFISKYTNLKYKLIGYSENDRKIIKFY